MVRQSNRNEQRAKLENRLGISTDIRSLEYKSSPPNTKKGTKEMKPYGYVWTSLKDGMETRFTKTYPNEFYKPLDIVPVYRHLEKEKKVLFLSKCRLFAM